METVQDLDVTDLFKCEFDPCYSISSILKKCGNAHLSTKVHLGLLQIYSVLGPTGEVFHCGFKICLWTELSFPEFKLSLELLLVWVADPHWAKLLVSFSLSSILFPTALPALKFFSPGFFWPNSCRELPAAFPAGTSPHSSELGPASVPDQLAPDAASQNLSANSTIRGTQSHLAPCKGKEGPVSSVGSLDSIRHGMVECARSLFGCWSQVRLLVFCFATRLNRR